MAEGKEVLVQGEFEFLPDREPEVSQAKEGDAPKQFDEVQLDPLSVRGPRLHGVPPKYGWRQK